MGNLYPPHHLGGYELVWQATVRALRDRGHDVRVLCTDTYLDADRLGDEDTDVHRALHWYWRDHGWPRLRLRDRRRLERHDRDVLALHVRDFAPDAIAFFAMGGLPISLVTANRCPRSASSTTTGWSTGRARTSGTGCCRAGAAARTARGCS